MFTNINYLFIQATNDKAEKTTPDFTCSVGNHKYYFHTHAPAAQTIYHLEKNALTDDHPTKKLLIDLAASHRNAIQLTKAVIASSQGATLEIPYSWWKDDTKGLDFILFQEYMPCVIFQQFYIASRLRSMLSESRKRDEQGPRGEQKKSKYFLFWNSRDDPCPNVWI